MNAWQILRLVKAKIFPSQHERRLKAFHSANAGGAIIFKHDLCPSATVLDVGGFEGDFSAEIMARYRPIVHIFEPIDSHNQILKQRFARNPSIHLHPFALGAADCSMAFSVAREGSSALRGNSLMQETCQVRAVEEWWKSVGKSHVDLVKINIEGGEYDLIPAMHACGLLKEVDRLLVQFHDFGPEDQKRRLQIRDILSREFDEEYCQTFVWERWRRKGLG